MPYAAPAAEAAEAAAARFRAKGNGPSMTRAEAFLATVRA